MGFLIPLPFIGLSALLLVWLFVIPSEGRGDRLIMVAVWLWLFPVGPIAAIAAAELAGSGVGMLIYFGGFFAAVNIDDWLPARAAKPPVAKPWHAPAAHARHHQLQLAMEHDRRETSELLTELAKVHVVGRRQRSEDFAARIKAMPLQPLSAALPDGMWPVDAEGNRQIWPRIGGLYSMVDRQVPKLIERDCTCGPDDLWVGGGSTELAHANECGIREISWPRHRPVRRHAEVV